ncbi:hypothetical protein FJR38_27185 [Anabaena sp. UHCC 0253]|uniref:hypothetical protein n=1 Tax=Anabaena sp. UHCC 0253 TaxID=2590019 RepID=UPI0014455F70|nr:hypothetical protein [Anabaena sp. UHCC 0253]MTJ56065.1 hypothetical protein [Anabaena sp. UHCC 0253]
MPVFYTIELFGFRVQLFEKQFFSYSFTIWLGDELVGRNIEGKFYHPWFSVRKVPPKIDFKGYPDGIDPDDIPF